MPYISSGIIIAKTQYDRRIRLSDQDKDDTKEMYKNGSSIRSIARHFNVDKRSIQFILFPERLERNKQLRAERGGSKEYYDKDKWKETMKEHRKYKHNLYLKGKIKVDVNKKHSRIA